MEWHLLSRTGGRLLHQLLELVCSPLPSAPLSLTRPHFWPSLSVLIVGESSWPSSRPTPRRTPRRRHCFQSCCFCSLAWVVHYDRNCKISSKRGQVDILPRELFLCWLNFLIKKMFLEIGFYYSNFHIFKCCRAMWEKKMYLVHDIKPPIYFHQTMNISLRKFCVMIFF